VRRTLAIAAALALLAVAATAGAASDVVKQATRTVQIAAGKTRTVNVPYPDALKYGNATYSGEVIFLGAVRGAAGTAPRRGLVSVLDARSMLGGSEYMARIHNANVKGSAPVRVEVVARTLEPLPRTSRPRRRSPRRRSAS
jgi:hypothetical protein